MARRRDATQLFSATDELRADYDMVANNRLQRRRRVPAGGSAGDYHYRNENDFLKCMEYARDAVRNDIVCSSMVDRATTNTMQDGFVLDMQTSDESVNKLVQQMWNGWAYDADECDVAQENTFTDMETMSFSSSVVDGDISAVGTDDGSLQWYEAHRNRTPRGSAPNIVHGVELLPGRVKASYWFSKDDLSPLMSARSMPTKDGFANLKTRDSEGIRRVFQVYLPNTVRRFTQTRGVSAFAPMFAYLGMHDDTQFNAILKQQIVNALIIFKERNKEFNAGGGDSTFGPQETQQSPVAGGDEETLTGIGPGTTVSGKIGETFKIHGSSVPGTEFLPHVKMILTLLGINLGLPLVLVLMDAKETNFSGWRGAFEQAKMGFRRNQQKMIRRFHDPVLYWKLSQWMAANPVLKRKIEAVIRKDGELKHIWHTPTWPYVQPLDDCNADLIQVANYQRAPSAIAAKNGIDYETDGYRGIADREKMIIRAIERMDAINSKFPNNPNPVVWEQLYTPPQPKHVNLSVAETRDQSTTTGDAGAAPA